MTVMLRTAAVALVGMPARPAMWSSSGGAGGRSADGGVLAVDGGAVRRRVSSRRAGVSGVKGAGGEVAVDVDDEVGGGAGVEADGAVGGEFGDDGVGDGVAGGVVEVAGVGSGGVAGVDGDVAGAVGFGDGDVEEAAVALVGMPARPVMWSSSGGAGGRSPMAGVGAVDGGAVRFGFRGGVRGERGEAGPVGK